jgi:hypothetical protein
MSLLCLAISLTSPAGPGAEDECSPLCLQTAIYHSQPATNQSSCCGPLKQTPLSGWPIFVDRGLSEESHSTSSCVLEPMPNKRKETRHKKERITNVAHPVSISPNILLSRLSPYVDDQCGFRRNRSTTDQIFCVHQILEKKWEYNETVHQLLINSKKVYDSVRRKVLYNILVEFGVPMKLVRLIRMCLNETYSEVRIGKHLSDSFLIQNGL